MNELYAGLLGVLIVFLCKRFNVWRERRFHAPYHKLRAEEYEAFRKAIQCAEDGNEELCDEHIERGVVLREKADAWAKENIPPRVQASRSAY